MWVYFSQEKEPELRKSGGRVNVGWKENEKQSAIEAAKKHTSSYYVCQTTWINPQEILDFDDEKHGLVHVRPHQFIWSTLEPITS